MPAAPVSTTSTPSPAPGPAAFVFTSLHDDVAAGARDDPHLALHVK